MSTLTLKPIGTFATGIFDDSAAEIVAHDPASQRVFVVNGADNTIDVLDIGDPADPQRMLQFDLENQLGAGGPNSVAVRDGIVAVAYEADPGTDPGLVAFFDIDGVLLNTVTVGALPDMITFTPDGAKIVVANEGEPDGDIDPEGSVSIIDLSAGVLSATVQTADFTAFDGREDEFRAEGIRIFPDKTVSVDVEPEYIAVSGGTAYVSLQEANALAVVDIDNAVIQGLVALGGKNHNQGQPTVETYTIDDLPDLGTTPAGQTLSLGGFSGLWYDGTTDDGQLKFLTVPDRGPNGAPTDTDGDGADERPFALPEYQARIVPLTLDPHSGQVTIDEAGTLFLTREDGTPISGLPNIAGVDEEPVDLNGELLGLDHLGADMEGIVRAHDGTFWTVDEYRPAIYHFDAHGVLIDRFVPCNTAEPAGGDNGDFGTETLPEEYAERRPNRGFEAVAINEDNDVVYAFIQTPLANPEREDSDTSDIIRILGIDTHTGKPVAEYVYLLERPDVRPGGAVDKIGDAVYAGDGRFYVIERDAEVGATAKKYIFDIDISKATNLIDEPPMLPDGETLEQQTAGDLADLGILPVAKTKVTNLPSIGYDAGDKPEGLALLPDGRLAVINDNDFGLLDEPIPGDGTVPLNPDPTPTVLGLIDLGHDNGLDSSDEDGVVNIANRPVYGLYMPDAIAAYEVDGATYVVTANEGDARDADVRVEDLTLDGDTFPDAAALQDETVLGRLDVSSIDGDRDGDGEFEQLFSYGARSFSIWDAYGNLVFDSADELEQLTVGELPDDAFNATNDEQPSFDNRSDNKGPEPEGVTIATFGDQVFAFVGLERVGGVVVYDITDPSAPAFVEYDNNRDFTVPLDPDDPAGFEAAGDLGPEGLIVIDGADSPTGEPLLVVGNEVSGTTTISEIDPDGLIL